MYIACIKITLRIVYEVHTTIYSTLKIHNRVKCPVPVVLSKSVTIVNRLSIIDYPWVPGDLEFFRMYSYLGGDADTDDVVGRTIPLGSLGERDDQTAVY